MEAISPSEDCTPPVVLLMLTEHLQMSDAVLEMGRLERANMANMEAKA